MTSQYTKASAVKKYIEKKILEQVSKEELGNFEFDIFKAKDREQQDFLYIYLIDKNNFGDKSINDELFQKIGSIIKTSIQNNCSNLMEIVSIEEDAGRQLLWLPKDSQCFTIYERYEEIDEFSIKPVKKQKIK